MKPARKNKKQPSISSGNKSPQLQLALPKAKASETTDKSLEVFLQSASHELSNVLGTVLGELDYGLSNPNPTVKARAMTTALQAAERARSLARNLCYFAIHAHRQKENYSLTQLVSDTIELSQSEFLHRRIRPQVTVETNVVAQGNSGAIQQGLLNIFRRAMSTMPQGGTLTVTLARKPGHIEILCRDNGVGIPEQSLNHLLFPPFSATSEDRRIDPNDLELFITRLLAEKEGARFDVKSSVGIGTTYVLRLPTDENLPKRDIVEHRRFRRVQAVLPVEISFNGFTPFRSEIETLSIGGCFAKVLEAPAKLPQKESVGSLRIYYYQDQVLDIHRCRIASQTQNAGQAGMGIEFLEIDPKAEKILRAIVHSHGFAIQR